MFWPGLSVPMQNQSFQYIKFSASKNNEIRVKPKQKVPVFSFRPLLLLQSRIYVD